MKPTPLLLTSALAAVIVTQAHAAIINHSMVIDAQNSFPNEGIEVVDGENPPTVVDLMRGGQIDSQRAAGPHVVLRDTSQLNLRGGSIGPDGDGLIQVRDTAQLRVQSPLERRFTLLGAELFDQGRLTFSSGGEIYGITARGYSTVYGAHGVLDDIRLYDNASARLIEMGYEFDPGINVALYGNSTLRITGEVMTELRAYDNATIWSESTFTDVAELRNSSQFHILNFPTFEAANDIYVRDNSVLHVYGTDLEYSDPYGDGHAITGKSRDGRPIYQTVHLLDNGTLVLHNLPEPSAVILTAIGGAALFFGRRFACR